MRLLSDLKLSALLAFSETTLARKVERANGDGLERKRKSEEKGKPCCVEARDGFQVLARPWVALERLPAFSGWFVLDSGKAACDGGRSRCADAVRPLRRSSIQSGRGYPCQIQTLRRVRRHLALVLTGDDVDLHATSCGRHLKFDAKSHLGSDRTMS
ncbi:unnamed protein product [Angiostrongylus costaricensis]|uniref:Secreted protein n=1 Tax=Angiostrongylus costaricensis TaxID=334426 RepID=A0A0R3PDC6_ANGCS|nr:unnamed protein product [Angiostrongylus costaricensis]